MASETTRKLTERDADELVALFESSPTPLKGVYGGSYFRKFRLQGLGMLKFLPPRLTWAGFEKAEELRAIRRKLKEGQG